MQYTNTKKYFKHVLVIAVGASLLSACKDYKPEMERALMERDSIQLIGEAKDSSINAFLESLTQIEANLDSITQNQQAISEATSEKVEFNKDIRERINYNIRFINELLEKNKEMISSLNEKLKNSNYKVGSLKKMVEQLNQNLAVKDSELAILNTDLAGLRLVVDSLNVSITDLRSQNEQKDTVIGDQTNQLNTAFWVMGNSKQLRENNIIDKQGGFLGLGKEEILRKDFDSNGFTQIDITKVTSFDINNKSVKIVTTHPTNSYTLEKDAKGVVTKLLITDPTRFWKASKYLVIVTG